MKKALLFAAIATWAMAAMSCGSGPAEKTDGRSEAVARIQAMEDTLNARPGVDAKGAQALVDVYLLYAKQHPLDSVSPEYVLRAAGVKSALRDPQAAVDLYDRVIKSWPHWRKLPDAYYLKAFTIDNGLHAKGQAQQAYQEVIDRFPEHPFAADARQMIQNLAFTDEELIARFKQLNDTVAAATAE
jgi:outer membrane protein assembly factor BamD (BamD/ComL family)